MAGVSIGSISQVSVSARADSLGIAAAVNGTTPYAYQWYRSTTTLFAPGAGNSISGATGLALADSGLTPGTIYYYKVVVIDSAGTPTSATTSQLVVTTVSEQPNQNQFTEAPFLGMLDQRFNPNTLECMFDPTGSGTLVGGQAVKWSTVAGPLPMVVPSTSQSDVVAGFVNYDIKSIVFKPGDRLEISQTGNVQYLYATAAINRGTYVCSIPSAVAGGCIGGVVAVTGSSGFPIVGYAMDTAVSGAFIRIQLNAPQASYAID